MKSAPHSIALPVPLTDWIVTPSIDFITLTAPDRKDLYALRLALLNSGNVQIPGPRKDERDVITLQTPNLTQLQTVIDHAPNMQIYMAEFTLDFRPKGDAADLAELVPVFRWFADCLCPCPDTLGAKRRYFDVQTRRWPEVPAGPSEAITTHVWRNGLERVKQRLYLKTLDRGEPVPYPSVRLEATFGMSACSDIGFARAWQLATFGQDLRRALSPLFRIGAGVKPGLRRSRALRDTKLHDQREKFNQKAIEQAAQRWHERGAMGAVKRGLDVIPDKTAHKRIGDALERLRNQLLELELPKISRAAPDHMQLQAVDFLVLDSRNTLLPIGGRKYEYISYRKKPAITAEQ